MISDEVMDAISSMGPDELAERGLTYLPKDADGNYIHIGDVVYDCNESLSEKFSVATMQLCKWGWSLIDSYGERNEPCQCRIHHEPTVEELLDEMYGVLEDARIPNGSEQRTYDEIISEYADKLREVMADECK